MKRITAALFALVAVLLLAPPAAAADSPTDLFGSFAWSDSDVAGRNWSADFDIAWGKIVAVGPVFRARYFSEASNPDPEDEGSLTVYELGGQLVVHMSPTHKGFHAGIEATYEGSGVEGYGWAPFAGFQHVWEHAAFRARYRQLFHEANGETTNLDRGELAFGFGWQF